jgi:hypothetical protein
MFRAARLAFAFTLCARALAAQDLIQLCQAAANVAVGQWASYAVSAGRDSGAQLRLAIVNSERHGDSTFYWFEMRRTSVASPANDGVVQMLVPGFGAQLVAVHALVVKGGGTPAMRLPEQMAALMTEQVRKSNPALDMAMRCESARTVGWEKVVVPAGPIRALHVADDGGDEAWRVANIPFGLVKLRLTEGSEMALVDHGAGAQSSISEPPLPMGP